MPNIAEMNKMFYDLNWVIILHKYIHELVCIIFFSVCTCTCICKDDMVKSCGDKIYLYNNCEREI